MSDNNTIEKQFSALWGGIIEEYGIDFLIYTIYFKGIIIDLGKKYDFDLRFLEASSFYYVSEDGERRFAEAISNQENGIWPYCELTSIEYYPERFGAANMYIHRTKVNAYPSIPNIRLEFWNAYFFIEANKVIINGEEYILK